MANSYLEQILPLLRRQKLVSEDCSKEECYSILFCSSHERVEILQFLICQLSDEFEYDFTKADNAVNELARKLFELQFTKSSSKFSFVYGSCGHEEQKEIYEKIFKAVHFVMLTQNVNEDNRFSNNLTTAMTEQPRICKRRGELKKSKKEFNLEEAKKCLKNVDEVLKRHKIQIKGTEGEESACSSGVPPLSDDVVADTCGKINSLSQRLRNVEPSKQRLVSTDNNDLEKFNETVENLHRSLSSVCKATEYEANDWNSKIQDTEKIMEELHLFNKNSMLLKLRCSDLCIKS